MTPEQLRKDLESLWILFSCEGGHEDVVVRMLRDAGYLRCPVERITDIARERKAEDIQEKYLGYSYKPGLAIVRVVDTKTGAFELGKLYKDRFPVYTIRTSPEIEMLVIINEDRYDDFQREKSNMDPSIFCKVHLSLPDIKRPAFLQRYWNAESLRQAILEYKRLQPSTEDLLLADLLAD